MTDTPDKEWIERATQFVRRYCLPFVHHDQVAQHFARELQSSFDQGVERERERCAAIAAAEAKAQRFDSEKFVAERIEEEILTPALYAPARPRRLGLVLGAYLGSMAAQVGQRQAHLGSLPAASVLCG